MNERNKMNEKDKKALDDEPIVPYFSKNSPYPLYLPKSLAEKLEKERQKEEKK